MPRFLIERSVEAAEGSQTFWVDADTEEEAIKKHKAGDGGGLYAHECEVTHLGEPFIAGTTTDDDTGDFEV